MGQILGKYPRICVHSSHTTLYIIAHRQHKNTAIVLGSFYMVEFVLYKNVVIVECRLRLKVNGGYEYRILMWNMEFLEYKVHLSICI